MNSFQIDNLLEIPTCQNINPSDGCNRNMLRIYEVLHCHNTIRNVRISQRDGFIIEEQMLDPFTGNTANISRTS